MLIPKKGTWLNNLKDIVNRKFHKGKTWQKINFAVRMNSIGKIIW